MDKAKTGAVVALVALIAATTGYMVGAGGTARVEARAESAADACQADADISSAIETAISGVTELVERADCDRVDTAILGLNRLEAVYGLQRVNIADPYGAPGNVMRNQLATVISRGYTVRGPDTSDGRVAVLRDRVGLFIERCDLRR